MIHLFDDANDSVSLDTVEVQVDGEAEVDRGGEGAAGVAGLGIEGGAGDVIKSHHSFTHYTGKKFLVKNSPFSKLSILKFRTES
jgi:hypothetical protein